MQRSQPASPSKASNSTASQERTTTQQRVSQEFGPFSSSDSSADSLLPFKAFPSVHPSCSFSLLSPRLRRLPWCNAFGFGTCKKRGLSLYSTQIIVVVITTKQKQSTRSWKSFLFRRSLCLLPFTNNCHSQSRAAGRNGWREGSSSFNLCPSFTWLDLPFLFIHLSFPFSYHEQKTSWPRKTTSDPQFNLNQRRTLSS